MLGSVDKDLIADWSNACEADAARAETAGYFFDLEAAGVRGDALAAIVSRVEKMSWQWFRTADGPRTSVQLVTGFRGSGKTTILRRAASRLGERGFAVLYSDAASVHDLAHPVTAREFVAMIFALLANHELGRSSWPAYRQRALELMPLRMKEVQGGVGIVSLAFERRDEGDDGLLERARALCAELAASIAKRVRAKGQELVVIVDSLEKFTGGPLALRDVIHSVEAVFTRHHDALRLPEAHCIYTIPPILAVHGPVADAFGGTTIVLPSVKVVESDGRPHEPGIAALRGLLALRIDLGRAFASEDEVRRLVRVSGGHVQDLLNLTFGVLDLQWRRGAPLPVGTPTVEDVVTEVQQRRAPLEAGSTALLRRIDGSHEVSELGPDDYERLIGLLDNYMVLAYQNGRRWYGVHPLTREALDARERMRGST